ncbi:Rabenosyn-5 [Aphelenchoides besseyi]|nr:Rabenosyn-5 [Aphelenchoides besseyi]KAI6212176.1 Rabenosyn-5 [Aphelenchoides besseyi]
MISKRLIEDLNANFCSKDKLTLDEMDLLDGTFNRNVNHVVGIEDGRGRYMMGNVEVDLESLRESYHNSNKRDETVCAVCNGKANGLHFGAISCAACNAYFRRSTSENRKYVCRKNGNCLVDHSVRTVCRCCRLLRCLLVGMRPEAVQPHRDTIGKKMKTGRYSKSISPDLSQIHVKQEHSHRCTPYSRSDNHGKSFQVKRDFSSSHSSNYLSNSGPSSNEHGSEGQTEAFEITNRSNSSPSSSHLYTNYMQQVDDEGLIEHGLRAYARLIERRRLIYGDRSIEKLINGDEPEYKLWKGTTNHYRLHENFSVGTANLLEFVRSFYGFSQLDIADQVVLFRHFGASFIILEKYYLSYQKGGLHTKRIFRQDFTYIQLSDSFDVPIDETTEIDSDRYFIPPEAKNSDGQLIDDTTLTRLATPHIKLAMELLIRPMEEIHMTDVEFVALSLSILFETKLKKLSSKGRDQVQELRNQLWTDWFSYYETLGDSIEEAAIRMGNTLLMLAVLDDFNKHYQEHFHLLRVFGITEYDTILNEFFTS